MAKAQKMVETGNVVKKRTVAMKGTVAKKRTVAMKRVAANAMTAAKAETNKKSFSEANRIADFIGIRNGKETSDLKLVDRVARGFPVSSVDTVVKRVDPTGSLLRAFDIVPRQTYYRKKENREPLSKDHSETILALSKVFLETLRQYHGEEEAAVAFLKRSHSLLGGRTPLEIVASTTAGADLVLKLLAQAEAGVAI